MRCIPQETDSDEREKGGGDKRQWVRWRDEGLRKREKWKKRRKEKKKKREENRNVCGEKSGYKKRALWERCRNFTKKIFK